MKNAVNLLYIGRRKRNTGKSGHLDHYWSAARKLLLDL